MVDFAQETWKPVAGWEELYEVSNLGNIRSLDRVVPHVSKTGTICTRRIRGRQLKPYPHKAGYPQIRLCGNGSQVAAYMHHLVAEAFIGPRPDGMQVAHNDGNPRDPSAFNLRYATPKENMADCEIHDTKIVGERMKGAKLSDAKVREIRASKGIPQSHLARRYGVTQSQIWCVLNKITWKHVKSEAA